MKTATLYRYRTGDDGTFGLFCLDGLEFWCHIVELPWRDNKVRISCIPEGDYIFRIKDSPKHGQCYEIDHVTGRTDIQIHSLNWAGDKSRGFKCQALGCLGPGDKAVKMSGQHGVTNSAVTTIALEQALGKEPFKLKIRWTQGVKP